MKGKFFIVASIALVSAACSHKTAIPRFEPYVIENLEPRPDFWKVRPSEVIDLCSHLSKGKAEVVATTPLGFPVYAVFYGDFSEPAPQTNYSAGNSSSALSAYLGDVSARKQTIMFIAGVHGSEPENVAAACNLIQLFETGRDFTGKEDPEFLELASKYRFIIMPCVNMDGRSISPDHFRGQPYEVFRGCSQGWWKDGSLVGWKGSKEWFPLPLDKVSYPGGYPNSEGYNIQHDACPGNMKTEEAKAICRLLERWHVDFMLNGHSCEYPPFLRAPSLINTPGNIERGLALTDAVHAEFFACGLNSIQRKPAEPTDAMNITNLTTWCSGGLGLTLEVCHSCYTSNGRIFEYSFEQMMSPARVALKVIMREGLKSPLATRRQSVWK